MKRSISKGFSHKQETSMKKSLQTHRNNLNTSYICNKGIIITDK